MRAVFPQQAKQVAKHATKRPRPSSDDDEEGAGEAFPTAAAAAAPGDFKSAVKPLVSKLVAMKWPGWSNPFVTVFKKSNAPPRYFDFIKRPMNLTFVRDNLSKNKYTSVSEYLVGSNRGKCHTSTPPGRRELFQPLGTLPLCR